MNQLPATSVLTKVREEQAERRAGVQQGAGFDALLLGHDFRDHGRARGPFTADAEAGDDAEHDELPHLGDEGAASRAQRVQSIVSISTRLRPKRSQMGPKITPPAAQPSSRMELRMPVQYGTAALASGPPIGHV